jgi:hypothetical protein
MLTLKMCFAWTTQWVGGVTTVTELESAHLPANFDPKTGDALDHFAVLKRVGSELTQPAENREEWPAYRAWQGTIHVGTYEPDTFVKALLVETEGKRTTDTYIVPSLCTYLLGPDGSNVDRL